MWGGLLGVGSILGNGSCFWFTVGSAAIAPKTQVPTKVIMAETVYHNVVANLLLVEDSQINQVVIRSFLEMAGHQVDVVDSGAAAIAAVALKHYDLIFMDVSMPDMSRMEATKKIRQMGGAAALVPIIAITGHAINTYKELCLASGMNGYATKPISKTDLLGLVNKWCH